MIAVVVVVVVAVVVVVVVVVNVFLVVPVIAYEIDGPPAGVIFAAMLLPVFLVARTYVQIHRWSLGVLGRGRNDDWLRVDHWRARVAADVDLPVEAGLSSRYADTLNQGCSGDGKAQRKQQKPLHKCSSVVFIGSCVSCRPHARSNRNDARLEVFICSGRSSRDRSIGRLQVSAH